MALFYDYFLGRKAVTSFPFEMIVYDRAALKEAFCELFNINVSFYKV